MVAAIASDFCLLRKKDLMCSLLLTECTDPVMSCTSITSATPGVLLDLGGGCRQPILTRD